MLHLKGNTDAFVFLRMASPAPFGRSPANMRKRRLARRTRTKAHTPCFFSSASLSDLSGYEFLAVADGTLASAAGPRLTVRGSGDILPVARADGLSAPPSGGFARRLAPPPAKYFCPFRAKRAASSACRIRRVPKAFCPEREISFRRRSDQGAQRIRLSGGYWRLAGYPPLTRTGRLRWATDLLPHTGLVLSCRGQLPHDRGHHVLWDSNKTEV